MDVNVFTGPEDSGKSELAKLLTICKAPGFFLPATDATIKGHFIGFETALIFYNIHTILQSDTEILFDSLVYSLSYKEGIIEYIPKMINRIERLDKLKLDTHHNINEIKEIISSVANRFYSIRQSISRCFGERYAYSFENDSAFINLDEPIFSYILKSLNIFKQTLSVLGAGSSLYIPSQRTAVNHIEQTSANDAPTPQYISSFHKEMTQPSPQEIDLSCLNADLAHASSIQSMVPMLQATSTTSLPQSMIIEQPELNLTPNAQYELIRWLELKRKTSILDDCGTIYTYITQSPYVLSAFNNMLYSGKVFRTKGENAEPAIKEIMGSIIGRYCFAAYEIKNGTATSIFDREAFLIMDNYITKSGKMQEDFNALTELMK